MEINQYMGMFLEESREHLQILNKCLLDLENDPSDLTILDEIFRSAHTIKGMSATMGFTAIAGLTHEMENILDMLRKAELKANHDIIDTLFKCVDTLERLVEDITSGSDSSIDVTPLLDKLHLLSKGEQIPVENQNPVKHESIPESVSGVQLNTTEVQVIIEAQNKGLRAYEIQISLRESCLLRSARAYMVMNTLDELCDVIRSIPPVEELEKENFDHSFQVIVVTDAEPDNIQQRLLSISEIDMVAVLPCEVKDSSDVPFQDKDSAPIDNVDKASSSEDKIKQTPSAALPANTGEKKIAKGGQSVRVDIERLDALLNLVGELVINKTRLEQIGLTYKLTELVETIEQMDRVTGELQAVVMKVRMVPVGQVFNRFPRMVRDLSQGLKKEINLIIQGEETELDRTVIDEIGDPLVHLLRNAIDHGIESPAERQAKGKNPVGEVRLIASHEGNNVVITVEDDGKGINSDIIKQKALQKNLITQAEADKMDNTEAVRLVFLPGFSTAETVTDVSGRGVGMDAVKTKIESLGGLVDVETTPNAGSKFSIRLPLTLAIIQALMIKTHEEIYAIPLGSIDSTIILAPDDIKTIQNQEVILLRGQTIPIVRLANILSIPETSHQRPDELFVVIVHMGERRAGIVVDTLIGQQEIVIKSLGKLLSGIKVIAGATILGNGQVALILDVGSLMSH